MKIISKYKDYYDYLQGIYGIDEKLVLDRTDFTPLKYQPYENTVVRFWICGFLVEGLFDGKRFLYGDELKELASNDKKQGRGAFSYYINQHMHDTDFFWYLSLPPIRAWTKIAKFPIPFHQIPKDRDIPFREIKKEECPNDTLNCPILIQNRFNANYEKFPILAEYSLYKVFSAHKLWILLTEWLGREKIIPNNQTDSEKVISNGFDLKTSFRHPVK